MAHPFARYWYKCNVCDATDHGRTAMDYEIVDCPACGSQNMTRWVAPPNLTREWAYCETFGHDWQPPPGRVVGLPTKEICTCCSAVRDF